MLLKCLGIEIFEDSPLWAKRRVFLVGSSRTELNTSAPEEQLQEQQEAIDLGERKIRERLNKPPDEQKDFIKKRVEDTHENIKELVKNWNSGEVLSVLLKPMLKALEKVGVFEGANLNQIVLSESLEQIARKQADEVASKFLRGNAVQEYARSAINIVGHKINACDKLMNDVQGELVALRERKEIIAKANRGISALLSNTLDWAKSPFSSDNLRGRIQRLEELHMRVSQVKQETEKRQEVKGKKEEQIRQWHEGITTLIAPYLGEDEMPEFQELLRNAVVYKTGGAESQFEQFVKSKKIKTESERAAIKNLLEYLIDGNYRGALPPISEKISDYVGAITAADTGNYFQRQLVEVGRTNEMGLEEQLKFLGTEKAKVEEQKVKVGDDTFILEAKDEDGFMLRMKGQKGFINIRNKEGPIFTLQKGTAGNLNFKRFRLVKSESSETGAIVFSIEEIKKEDQPDPAKKTEKTQETSSLVKALTRLIEELKQVLQNAAPETPAAKS